MPLEVYTLADLARWPEVTAGEPVPLRFAVLGDPVAHSASPQMQNAALQSCGIDARYVRLHISPSELPQALAYLPRQGFLGANLTIPHKIAALEFLAQVDEHARRLGAVNTVAVEGGGLVGYNTDGPGFVRAVRAEFGVDVRDLRVLLLGAGGGAGRGIAMQCGLERCERLVLVNRTMAKAEALLESLAPHFEDARVAGPVERLASVPWEEEILREQLAHTDLIINCSSLGLQRSDPSPLPANLLAPHHLVFDTVYAAQKTRLVQAAIEVGARAVGGHSLLLHQGALAFEIWTGREAPLAAMREGLAGGRAS